MTVQLRDFDSEFMRRDLVEASPLTWLLEVDRDQIRIAARRFHYED